VHEVAPGIHLIDTLLGGRPGVSAAYLVTGERPALVDTGARTSAPVVREALAAAGLGPSDLAWIVPTHVHLDHCGATGILAAAFPRATVVVHRRGARHLSEPGRLLAGSAAVYGRRWSIYGGLDPTPAARIAPVEGGHRIDVGPGRALEMLETPGHARHHTCLVDLAEGAVIAGDAVGVQFPGAGIYPALPPPDVDLAAGLRSLDLIARLRPSRLLLGHFGPVPDAAAAIDVARAQWRLMGEAGRAAASPGEVGDEIARRLPLEGTVADDDAVAIWRWLGWVEANADGIAGWAVRDGGERL
jgi:glyoxylase-like metal-dependent hydrolase (beta-lactamase superfamily II)